MEPADEELLARYGHQSAPPVAEGEVVKAVRPSRRQLIMLADDMGMASVSEAAEYARAVLARWGSTLTPVPVSERLPGPGDCDDEGTCWVWHTTAYTWGLFRLDPTVHSHWLPAHALPLPAGEVQP